MEHDSKKNQEKRYRLNLSPLAMGVLEEDMEVFMDSPSYNGMTNLALACYLEQSEAFVDHSLARYKEELKRTLQGVPGGKTKDAVMEALVEAYWKRISSRIKEYPQTRSDLKLFVKGKNSWIIGIINNWKDERNVYQGKEARFIKAVVEEYARKPYYEREEIILRERIEELNEYIRRGDYIEVALRRDPDQVKAEKELAKAKKKQAKTAKQARDQKAKTPDNVFVLKPCQIIGDSEQNYHYLVGLARRPGEEEIWTRPVSLRLSRIQSVKWTGDRGGLDPKEKRLLMEKLDSSGVQFLQEAQFPIRVLLTPNGRKMYNNHYHLRPRNVKDKERKLEDGNWLMEFNCTPAQAEYYFFRFGRDAVILEPTYLREKLARKFASAQREYTKNHTITDENAQE